MFTRNLFGDQLQQLNLRNCPLLSELLSHRDNISHRQERSNTLTDKNAAQLD